VQNIKGCQNIASTTVWPEKEGYGPPTSQQQGTLKSNFKFQHLNQLKINQKTNLSPNFTMGQVKLVQ